MKSSSAARGRAATQATFQLLLDVADDIAIAERLEARLAAQPLHDFATTGDLSDSGKIVVALAGEPEYRIVVKAHDGEFTVSEVIAVEDRAHDLPHLLAGLRMGRIDDAVRCSDAGRRLYRIRKILDQ